jgi:hypothetical protein
MANVLDIVFILFEEIVYKNYTYVENYPSMMIMINITQFT